MLSTRDCLKLKFSIGKTPTQQDFYDLLDSYINILDDNSIILTLLANSNINTIIEEYISNMDIDMGWF